MSICGVCGKETNGKEQVVHLHSANLLKRAVKKGNLGSSTTSVYKEFTDVGVVVCSRHLRALWFQRFMSGFLVLILVYLPIGALLSLVYDIRSNPTISIIVIFIISAIPVYLLVRRIAYDGFIAGLMNLLPATREARLEYFGEAKYRRILKRIAALDAEIARVDKLE